jgi:3-deoxy-D-arabino-heptulosonate 7-phosphate (DAHP) synthase
MNKIIKIGKNIEIGNGLPTQLIAGPCSVDKNIEEIIKQLTEKGIKLIRGGCWKPRSGPDSFRGFGEKAVKDLLQAAKKYEVEGVFIEVLDTQHIKAIKDLKEEIGFEGIITLWVGARTVNQYLLQELGNQTDFNIMIKNRIDNNSVEEWINIVEYTKTPIHNEEGEILKIERKNNNILLCSRGTKKEDESIFRFKPTHEWVEKAKQLFQGPVGVDPSHSAGTMKNDLVIKNLEDCIQYHPHFVLLEVYLDEDKPLTDANQSLPISRINEVQDILKNHNDIELVS